METKKMKTKKTKRLGIVILVVVLMASCLSACGGGNSDGGEAEGGSDEQVKIGIVQIVEHPSLNEIRENTIAQLEEEGFIDGETAIIDYQDAQNEQSNLKSICQKFVAEGYDIIIPIATPTAQAAAGETTEIPIVFSAVTDPVGAELVTDLQNPGGNITGVSDAVSATKIMNMALEITPDIKKIGALYTASEVNSQSVVQELKEYAAENGLEVVDKPITASNEIQQAAVQLASEVDAVFSPIDNTVAASMPIVVETFNNAKIPFYVGADSMVQEGGLATDGINYKELGKETGKIAARILNGEDPGAIPVVTMEKTQYYINQTTAEIIEVSFPIDMLKSAVDLGA